MDIKSLPEDVRANIRSGVNITTIPHCINELVLNSLDAKSTSIAIRINLNTFRLQVVDNGQGITKANLNLVGVQYMTNKCHTIEDYKNKLKYYGFKGETLSSIKSNSKSLIIATRPANDSQTYNKTYNGNDENDVTIISHRPSEGTTVTVEDFLFNTPVRQKCVSDTIFDEIRKNLERLSVMHPTVTFSLRNDINMKMIYKNTKVDSVEAALVNIFPEIDKQQLTQIKIRKNNLTITGLLYSKQLSNKKCQFIFVNKRPTFNLELQQEIQSILKDSTLCQNNKKETNFAFILNIKCPNSQIEVTTSFGNYMIQFKNEVLVKKCIQKLFTKFLEKENLTIEINKDKQKKPTKRKLRSQVHLSDIDWACKSKVLKSSLNMKNPTTNVKEDIKVLSGKRGYDLQIFDFPKRNKIKIKRTDQNPADVLVKQIQLNKETVFNELSNINATENISQENKVKSIVSLSDKYESFQGSGKFTQELTCESIKDLESIPSIDNEELGKAFILNKFLNSLRQSFSIDEQYSPDCMDVQTAVSVSVKIKQKKTIKRKKNTNKIYDDTNRTAIVNVEKEMLLNFDDAHTMVSKCIQTTQIDKTLYSQVFEDGYAHMITKNKYQTDTKCLQIDHNWFDNENLNNVSKYFSKSITHNAAYRTIVPGCRSIHIGNMDFFKHRWEYDRSGDNEIISKQQLLNVNLPLPTHDDFYFTNDDVIKVQQSYDSHNIYEHLSTITLFDSRKDNNNQFETEINYNNLSDFTTNQIETDKNFTSSKKADNIPIATIPYSNLFTNSFSENNDKFSFKNVKPKMYDENKEPFRKIKIEMLDVTLDSVLQKPEKYSSKPFKEINMFPNYHQVGHLKQIYDEDYRSYKVMSESPKLKSCLKTGFNYAIPYRHKYKENLKDKYNLEPLNDVLNYDAQRHKTCTGWSNIQNQANTILSSKFNEVSGTMFSDNNNHVGLKKHNIFLPHINILSDIVIRKPTKEEKETIVDKKSNKKINLLGARNDVFFHNNPKLYPQEQVKTRIIDKNNVINTTKEDSNLLFNQKYKSNPIYLSDSITNLKKTKSDYFDKQNCNSLTSITATKYESQLFTQNELDNLNLTLSNNNKVKKWLENQTLLKKYYPSNFSDKNSTTLNIVNSSNLEFKNSNNFEASLINHDKPFDNLLSSYQKYDLKHKHDLTCYKAKNAIYNTLQNKSNTQLSNLIVEKYTSVPTFVNRRSDPRKTKSEYFDNTDIYTPNYIIAKRFEEAQLTEKQINNNIFKNSESIIYNLKNKNVYKQNKDTYKIISDDNNIEMDTKSSNCILSSGIIAETETSTKYELDENVSSEQIIPPSDEQNFKFTFLQESLHTSKDLHIITDKKSINQNNLLNELTHDKNSIFEIPNVETDNNKFEINYLNSDSFMVKPKNNKLNKLSLIKHHKENTFQNIFENVIEDNLNTVGMNVSHKLNITGLDTFEEECNKDFESKSDLIISLSPEKILSLNNYGQNDSLQKIENEWTKLTNCYINRRTGMTTFFTPKDTNNYNLEKRKDFMPKGFSQMINREIIDIPLSATTKTHLYTKIAESYEDELDTIKWNYFINNNEPKKFFESIYKNRLKPTDSGIPDITKNNFSRLAVKSFNNQNSITFTKDIFNDIIIIGQLDKKFIVTLARKKTMILLFDQHAVHERIRVEMLFNDYVLKHNELVIFKISYLENEITIELNGDDIDLMLRYPDSFEKLGILYRIDGEYIQIIALPTCLCNKLKRDNDLNKFKKLLKNVLEEVLEIVIVTRGIICNIPLFIQNVINSEACRGSIMFGDELNNEQCEKYIKDLSKCNLPFQCAHGRPTIAPIIELINLDLKIEKVILKNILKN